MKSARLFKAARPRSAGTDTARREACVPNAVRYWVCPGWDHLQEAFSELGVEIDIKLGKEDLSPVVEAKEESDQRVSQRSWYWPSKDYSAVSFCSKLLVTQIERMTI